MTRRYSADEHGCGCSGDCDRREFLTAAGLGAGAIALAAHHAVVAGEPAATRKSQGARVRALFLYPPSKKFASNPEGWWSWPGNGFDAEGRQGKYTAALREMAKRHELQLLVDDRPLATTEDAERVIKEIDADSLDGLLLVMFYNNSLAHADLLLKAAEAKGVPVVFYIALGVKHGPITPYRRPGIYFIQSLENFDAIEYGLRMIATKKRMSQVKLLSITEADAPREGVEPFLGTTVKVVPFARYADEFQKAVLDAETRRLMAGFVQNASERRGVTDEALENAGRAHVALQKLLKDEEANGLTMNCLRRGMLKPCMSFSSLNSSLIPATCENDFSAMYTQMLGQQLTGRPGFQHNPCYDTERNLYYASHCTCATKLHGPEGPTSPYLLRRFAHTNEGSCAIQVFWKADEPVTMVRYYPGKPPALDVYAGKVVASHPMPPAAGCTTNVEIAVTDRTDVCQVRGHHNLLFCGDFARRFRLFAQLYKMKLAETGGPAPLDSYDSQADV